MTGLGALSTARVAAALGGAVSMLPDRLGRLVRPARYRGMPDELPPIDPLPLGKRRVLIGAINTAGQAHLWARAIATEPDTVAVNIAAVDTVFGFAADITVPRVVALASRDWQRRHARVRGFSATDVVIESGLPIFGPAFGWSLVREVRVLQRRGIRVAIVCHGSDVRDFEALNARNPHSPYLLPDYAALLPAMQRRSAAVRRAIRRTGAPVLGSTQGLLIDLPEATWAPVVVDPASWRVETPPLADDVVPLIVHAPSQSGIKGSDVIDAVVTRLVGEGLVRYERLESVSHDAVRAAYRRADIMIDSLRTGGYGVAACEAMAAGRVVVSHVATDYRDHLREHHGLELPIVHADPTSLEQVLRGLVDDRAVARAIAVNGPAYVSALHDGRQSRRALLAALDSPAALGARR